MHRLEPFLHKIDSLSEWTGKLLSIFVYAIAALLLVEIALRNLFNISFSWAADYILFLFGFLILTGGYTLLHGLHVSIDILHHRWSPKTRAIVDLITATVFFIFCGLMLWKGAVLAWDSIAVLEVDRFSYAPPIYIVKTLVPIAALLIILQGVAKFIRDLNIATGGDKAE